MNIFDGVDEARMAVAKRIEQDISYGRFLTLTLEANRTESVHQRHDRPAIFRKHVDELGLYKNVEIRIPYRGIITPPSGYSPLFYRLGEVFERLGQDDGKATLFGLMLLTNQIEGEIHKGLGKVLDRGPVFLWEYDDIGLPEALHGVNRRLGLEVEWVQ